VRCSGNAARWRCAELAPIMALIMAPISSSIQRGRGISIGRGRLRHPLLVNPSRP
jgi:hypothetical protein